MKSNVCKIEKGTNDLEAILKESERVAEYNGFNKKDTLQLRLHCEEVDGMLPNIIGDFEGSLWIEYDKGVAKVNVSIEIPELNVDKKDDLIAIAKNKKNASAVGIVGKIRSAIEDFFLDDTAMNALETSFAAFRLATGYSEGVDYTYIWSLQQYRDAIEKDDSQRLIQLLDDGRKRKEEVDG